MLKFHFWGKMGNMIEVFLFQSEIMVRKNVMMIVAFIYNDCL